MSKKIIVDIPEKLQEKIDAAKEKQMISKATLVRMAVNQYCDGVVKNE